MPLITHGASKSALKVLQARKSPPEASENLAFQISALKPYHVFICILKQKKTTTKNKKKNTFSLKARKKHEGTATQS